MSRRGAVAGLVAYLAVLAAGTLGASPGAVFREGARAARAVGGPEWVTVGVVDGAANVLFFAPAGLLLCYALPRVRRLVLWLLCVAVSVSVEAAQYLLPARDSSLVDVVTNSTGAAIGVLLHVLLTRSSRRRRSRVPT